MPGAIGFVHMIYFKVMCCVSNKKFPTCTTSTISTSTSWVIAIIVVAMVTCVAVATYCLYDRVKDAVSKLPFSCSKYTIFPTGNKVYLQQDDENEPSDSQKVSF